MGPGGCRPRGRGRYTATTHQYWTCNARSILTFSFANAWCRGGLTNVGLLCDTTQVQKNAIEVEMVEPKQTTSRKTDKVVRANGFARFIIRTQLQSKLPIPWYGWTNILQAFDFLDGFLDSPPQIRITHVGIGIDWLEACLISMECTRMLSLTFLSWTQYRAPSGCMRGTQCSGVESLLARMSKHIPLRNPETHRTNCVVTGGRMCSLISFSTTTSSCLSYRSIPIIGRSLSLGARYIDGRGCECCHGGGYPAWCG